MPERRGERPGDVEVAVATLRLLQRRCGPSAQTASPIGTLTNITQRHETSSVSSAAGHQADRSAGRRHGGEEADGPDPLRALGEDGGEEGQRGRRGQGGADSLQGAGGQEHPAGDGQAAERAS